MEYYDKEFCLEVWGPLACFTRPEFKVERVSYDVITPSAARAIFESIFWKPAIEWQITKIVVINPIKWTNVRRNEVSATAKLDRHVPSQKQIYINDNRDQRNTLLLKDVHYLIYAKLHFKPKWERKPSKNPLIDKEEEDLLRKDENPGKYNAMFERRAKKGQCFNTPYLGCREFSAFWKYIDTEVDTLPKPLPADKGGDRDFGLMFYDWSYATPDNKALFFNAIMRNGVIDNIPSKAKLMEEQL